jgi:hypothetical protein
MKLSITVFLSAITGTLACSHGSRPETAHGASTAPMQTALVSPAQSGTQAQPGAPTIPANNPSVPTPDAPAAVATEGKPLTPPSAIASLRPESTQQVQTDPARDKATGDADQESIREIRALLAADKSLSSTARQVTIVAQRGRVRLTGQVNTPAERSAIERSARQAANVIDVRNELVVLQ